MAILGVLLFHGFLGLAWTVPFYESLAKLPLAGWMGVDIFFALSGFLITGILLDTRNSAAYFRSFYARRFLRIIPVYYLLLAIVFFVLPWFVPFNTEGLKTIQHRQLWFWTHLTNLGLVFHRKIWTESDWLNLGPLWSLAVEEQFYLLWPWVVYFVSRRWLKVVCLACLVTALGLRIVLWQMGQRNGALYFPTPCRLDGLAMGALVAVLIRGKGGVAALAKPARLGAGLAAVLLGTLWLLRGGIVFNDKPTVVFGVALVSLQAACLVAMIAEQRPGSFVALALNHKFLRMTGKYSYGLYLFHAPLKKSLDAFIPSSSVVKAVGSELLGNLIFIALFFIVSYAAALLSWHAYEKHWLKLKRLFDYQPK